MRWYDIVSGILLILPVVDFALAAPVFVQEKQRQDVITVFGKRSGFGETYDEIDKAVKEYFANFGSPMEESGVHATSSSSRPGPDHGILPPPAQNPQLVNAHLYPWMHSPSVPPAENLQLVNAHLYPWMHSPSSPMMSLPPQTGGRRVSFQVPNEQSIADLPEQHGTSNAILDNAGSNKGDDMLQYSPASSGYDSDRAFFDKHPPPQPNDALPTTDSDSETDSVSNFDWNYYVNPEHSSPPRPVSATEPGHGVVTPPSTDPGNPSSSTGSQPEGLQVSIAAAKGKERVERSPDPGEDLVHL